MTRTRKIRLLKLARRPKGHRHFYGQYREIEYEGLCFWLLGRAHLTDKGKKFLEYEQKDKK